jgi:hypothetical protein
MVIVRFVWSQISSGRVSLGTNTLTLEVALSSAAFHHFAHCHTHWNLERIYQYHQKKRTTTIYIFFFLYFSMIDKPFSIWYQTLCHSLNHFPLQRSISFEQKRFDDVVNDLQKIRWVQLHPQKIQQCSLFYTKISFNKINLCKVIVQRCISFWQKKSLMMLLIWANWVQRPILYQSKIDKMNMWCYTKIFYFLWIIYFLALGPQKCCVFFNWI